MESTLEALTEKVRAFLDAKEEHRHAVRNMNVQATASAVHKMAYAERDLRNLMGYPENPRFAHKERV